MHMSASKINYKCRIFSYHLCWSIIANGSNNILHHIFCLRPKRLLLICHSLLRLIKSKILNSFQGMKLYYMKDLPLYQFKLLPTGPRKITFIEVSWAGVHEIAREVGASCCHFIAVVSDQQIIPSSESRPITTKTANSLIFQRLHKRVLGLISDREQKRLPPEVSFEMCGCFLKLILPAKRRITTDYLVIFSQTQDQGVFIDITDLVEGFGAEIMIARAIKKFKIDLIIEEGGQHAKTAND